MLTVATHNREIILDKEIRGQVLDLLKQFHEESSYKNFFYDKHKAASLYDKMLHDDDSVVILWIEGDYVAGVIVATCTSPIFSNERISTELVWYVLPQYRNSRIGLELFSSYEYWAREIKHVKKIAMAHLVDDRLDKYLRKKGYDKYEETYVKVLKVV